MPVAHVGKEVFKAIHPAVADFDSSSAVILVIDVVLIVASLAHCHPRIPFGGVTHAVSRLATAAFGPIGTF